jgi:hypothetical protein
MGGAGAGGAAGQRPQAGTITVSIGDTGRSQSLVPDANGNYATKSVAANFLSGGELLDVSATGGDAPAFHQTVENPLALLLSEPAMPDGGGLTVSRAQDLKLVWTRGTADGAFLVEGSSVSGGTITQIDCTAPADVGTMTIPAATLGKLPPKTSLLLIGMRVRAFQAGAYTVSIRIGSDVATPDKRIAASIVVE